jgi:DNA-binding CsgD family transcriptional regulator
MLESIRHSSYLSSTVAVLSRGDTERLLRFVADAENNGDQPVTPEFLARLGRLIEADFVGYNETDYVHRRLLMIVERAGDEDEDEDFEISDYEWELMHEHPVCAQWRKDGCFSALRLTDVVTRREFRRSRFYVEFWRPWGLEYELKVRLPSPPWHGKTFSFHRLAGRDFTIRDRLMLELLTPHLSRLWHAARRRRLLASAIDALETTAETAQSGVVLLGTGYEIEFASAQARRLLAVFFSPATAGRLPDDLDRWLDAGAAGPLRRRRGELLVTVERTGEALVFREQRVEVDLTPRETEVMGWVAQGKTNAQIAELLWLAPSTVRKHLENVYAKLGVSTRTAAAARFLGLITAEAS